MKIIPVANPNIGINEAKVKHKVIKSGWVSMGKKLRSLKKNCKIYEHEICDCHE